MSENKALVLVADDDDDIRNLIAFRLVRAGYDVITAIDGADAFALAAERLPNLILLDVVMPKATGLEVTKMLRGYEPTSRTPVILLTARVQEEDVARGRAAGADGYIKKPFSPQELHARVRAILERD